MPDFTSVGAPQSASYGGGMIDFSALSGGKPQPQQQQQQQPGYSLGQQIGQWLAAYRQQMAQNGMPTNIQPPAGGQPVWTPGGPSANGGGGSIGPNSGSAVY
jgi:hypothetical protein